MDEVQIAVAVGDRVQAVEQITEGNFNGHARWVHAEQHELGRVREVDGEWATVTWDRTRTTTDCHVSEYRRLAGDRAFTPVLVQIPDPRLE